MGRKRYQLKFDREVDGRWIASVGTLPGFHAYGATKAEAAAGAEDLITRSDPEFWRMIESRRRTSTPIPANEMRSRVARKAGVKRKR